MRRFYIFFALIVCVASYAQSPYVFNSLSQVDIQFKDIVRGYKDFEREREEWSAEPDGEINGHYFVDLGLPSGLKWATCNVGAYSPEGYGSYFSWGETSPKDSYEESNSSTFGRKIGDIAGSKQYDAARANWGGSWRLPRMNEIEELVNNCTWTWSEREGIIGYEVTGPNGKSIFLPAAGYRSGSSYSGPGREGIYWSGSSYGNAQGACDLSFNGSNQQVGWDYRDRGRSVRAVSQ